MTIPDPQPGQYGHGQLRAGPVALAVDVSFDYGATFTDLGVDYIPRDNVRLERDNMTGAVTGSMTIVQHGGGYVVQDNLPVHIYDKTATPYIRWFDGYIMGASSTAEGAEKVWECRLVGKGQVVMAKPPKQLLTQWPPGDGTPVVDTPVRASVAAGANRTIQTIDPQNLAVGKKYFAYNSDFTNYERITLTAVGGANAIADFALSKTVASTTVASGNTVGLYTATPASMTGITNGKTLLITDSDGYSHPEYVTASNVTGTTFDATYTIAHGAGYKVYTAWWVLQAGVSSTDLLRDGFSAQDPTARTVAASISPGSQAVSPVDASGNASMTDIFVSASGAPACYVYCANADGTQPEMLLVTAVTATTFTASFTRSKSANWVVRPLLWYYGFFDEFYNNSSQVTIAGGISAGNDQTITLGAGNMTHVVPVRTLWVENADGSNREAVFVESVTATGFVADFQYAKAANWIVYNGFAVDLGAIDEVQQSLPHLKWPEGTPHLQIIEEIKQNVVNAPNVATTSSTAVTAGTNATVTVGSTSGMAVGDVLRCYNSDLSNSERVRISAIAGSTITAYFTSAKSGTWHLVGGQQPDFYSTFPSDTGANIQPWIMQPRYYDVFDTNTRATVALKNATTINPDIEARYQLGYRRDVDGMERITHQDVFGAGGVYGSYTDTTAETTLKRRICGEVVFDDSLITAAECDDRAEILVRNFGRARDTVSPVKTTQLIDQYLMHEGKVVSWEHTLEGGTPAWYNIAQYSLDFSAEGVATHTFALGDAVPGMRDRPIPLYGASTLIDRTRPHAPTWAPGTGWVVSNTYSQYTDRVTIVIRWISSQELDLDHFMAEANDGRGWQNVVTTDETTVEATFPDILPGTTVRFRVTAWDRSGNPSDPSATVSTTAVSRTNPNAPTLNTTAQVYDPQSRRVLVTVNLTPSTSPNLVFSTFWVTMDGTAVPFTRSPNTTSEVFDMAPGTVFSIQATVTNSWNRTSSLSTPALTGTAVGPNAQELLNGGFEESVRFHQEWPAWWTRVEGSGSTVTRTSTPVSAYEGTYYLDLYKQAGGTNPSATSNIIDVDYRRTYRLRLARRCDVATTGLYEVLWLNSGGGSEGTTTLTLPTGDAPTSLWNVDSVYLTPPGVNASQAQIRITNNNTVTSHLYVDGVDWAVAIDQPDTHRLPTTNLYNPNFAIASPNGNQPDGYTISSLLRGKLDNTHVLSGDISYQTITQNSQNVTILSDAVSVLNPETSTGYFIKEYVRVMYYADNALGNIRARVFFKDKTGATLSTVTVIALAPPIATKNVFIEKRLDIPNGAVKAQLELYAEGTSALFDMNVWWGGLDMYPAITAPAISNLNVDQTDGAPLVLTKKDGTETSKVSYSGTGNVRTDYQLNDASGAVMGNLRSYDDGAGSKSIRIRSIGATVDTYIDAGRDMYLSPDQALLHSGVGGISSIGVDGSATGFKLTQGATHTGRMMDVTDNAFNPYFRIENDGTVKAGPSQMDVVTEINNLKTSSAFVGKAKWGTD